MGKIVPHVVFGALYLVLALAMGALLDAATGSDAISLQHLVGPVVAPFALVIAQRRGALSLLGVLAVSLLLAFGVYVAIVAILHGIAVPAGGAVPFAAPAKLGGWSFVLGNALLILSPVVWLHIINRTRGPKLASGSAA